jgi:hypothetical protein
MSYWLFKSPRGEFSIVERSSRGVDAYFCGHNIGHFANPISAARAIGAGSYEMPEMLADAGPPQDVPADVSDWFYVQ